MKKLLLIFLSLTLLLTVAAMSGCGEQTPEPCVEHIDDDGDFVCDVCDGQIEQPDVPPATDAQITFTVKDTDGNLLPGVTAIFTLASDSVSGDPVSATSGADGKFTLTLDFGEYNVFYDYDIDTLGYYLSSTTAITVEEGTAALDLLLIDNNPNGTEDKPYALSVGENDITVPAGAAHYYIIYRAIDLYLGAEGDGLKITYGSDVYTATAENGISFPLKGTDTNSVEMLLIENTASEEKTFSIEISSAPGTSANPIKITDLGEAIVTRELAAEESIYYTYTATESGIFTITLGGDNVYVSMINARNSQSVNSSSDLNDGVLTLEVEAGDEIIIDLSTTATEAGAVAFTPELNVPVAY